MAHLSPLAADLHPELEKDFAIFIDILGFIPNSLLTMQRKPAIVKGFGVLTQAVMSKDSEVDFGFKRLLAHFASNAVGCRYCEAHSLVAAQIHGIDDAKLAELWSYQTSELYSEAERVALDYALAAASVPNAVDEALMVRMKQHWSENQIVEILGAVCLYGFLNRWNDSMATDLEEAPLAMAQAVLDPNWNAGKHGG
ncbi:carboxymuconolactone decarboxylase family protein [Paraferrimonas sedimenticola]|uniref:Fusion protein n=1 Tax=Paraferrimonas sedimenticola TaxID=375674 RepID=A0AA37RXH5_9GAMM|nr:carboxymuconolactone decarboxylase family protein [Paraferrimonas sedimenticola]GLP97296.1 fusion protein [Paraferrimonas sedimenticola]